VGETPGEPPKPDARTADEDDLPRRGRRLPVRVFELADVGLPTFGRLGGGRQSGGERHETDEWEHEPGHVRDLVGRSVSRPQRVTTTEDFTRQLCRSQEPAMVAAGARPDYAEATMTAEQSGERARREFLQG